MIDEYLLKFNGVHHTGISYPLMHILEDVAGFAQMYTFPRKLYVNVINIYLEYAITKIAEIVSVNP